jgi:hypothetical protein
MSGKGWGVMDARAGFYDGSMNSRCGRQKDRDCLLCAHKDGRGTFIIDVCHNYVAAFVTDLDVAYFYKALVNCM